MTTTHERLDQYVVQQLPATSRSFAAKLIERGDVKVNGHIQTKAGYKVRTDDQVKINFDAAQAESSPNLNLPIIYEDKDCLVINKPAGVLTHSKGNFNPEATVATWIAKKVPGLKGERAGIVHRLDRATSGLMILAKTDQSHSWLQRQFADRKAQKTYMAVVKGRPKSPEAIIKMPIERNPRKPQTFRVGANGKPAETSYRIVTSNNQSSLLELKPKTGRTHQLRVHLQAIGHPILGDSLYGGAAADRLYLHAEKLALILPNKKLQSFEAKLPKTFKDKVA